MGSTIRKELEALKTPPTTCTACKLLATITNPDDHAAVATYLADDTIPTEPLVRLLKARYGHPLGKYSIRAHREQGHDA